jgi:hypothetical protein
MQQRSVLGADSAKPILVSATSLTQSYHFLRGMPRRGEDQCDLYLRDAQRSKAVNSSK